MKFYRGRKKRNLNLPFSKFKEGGKEFLFKDVWVLLVKFGLMSFTGTH
jgi:hypothetical protein